jgi:hypothetical protein
MAESGTHRWTRSVAAATAMSAIASCSSTESASVTITNDAAHHKVIAYMHESVDALPRGATLSDSLPGNSAATLGALNGPCDHDDDNPEQPYNWDLSMWILLPPTTSSKTAISSVTGNWENRGYKVTQRGADGKQATTSDGFVLFVMQAGTGDLSMTAVSPCFPKSQLDTTMSWPSTIQHS